MPLAYFDTSILLSILFKEEKSKIAADLWDRHPDRVSSILLDAECWTGMRRHFKHSKVKAPSSWLKERATFLEAALTGVSRKLVDAEVLVSLKEHDELTECRTLDAIHLATALFFRRKTDEGIVVISFDERMRQTAKKLKLDVLPA